MINKGQKAYPYVMEDENLDRNLSRSGKAWKGDEVAGGGRKVRRS